jgi:hypothetical protein
MHFTAPQHTALHRVSLFCTTLTVSFLLSLSNIGYLLSTVVLPGGALAAIDFQPLSEDADYLNGPLYAPFESRLKKWQTAFPSGGDLPEAAVSSVVV